MLHDANGVAVDARGDIFVAELYGLRIREVSNGIINTIAGGGSPYGDSGLSTNAQLYYPTGVTVGAGGNVLIADKFDQRIRNVFNRAITTVAGTGTAGFTYGSFSGDNGLATNAHLQEPSAVAVDKDGSIYVADSDNFRVRKISNGIITTAAGSGTDGNGFSGDGGPATSAQLNTANLGSIALDSAGNIYIADTNNQRIRKVSNGIITTVAGNGTSGVSGDNGPATSAQLNNPSGVAVHSVGNLYIADSYNQRVRKVSNGIITTVAGNGTSGNGGDNGPATGAQLYDPVGIAVDSAGNLFIADSINNRIRRVSNGIITTIAGSTGAVGFGGDNGPATSAQLYSPQGVAVDSSGNVYIADTYNNRIRLLTPSATVAPVLSSLSPNSTAAGSPAFILTVSGSGFLSNSAIIWNGSSLVTTYSSTNQLSASVSASLVAVAGSVVITVRNPDGTASNALTFNVSSSSLAILTQTPLPGGTVGTSYSQGLTATGGMTPYQGWVIATGSTLPPGISLTQGVLAGTGLLSGTPTSAGAFTFTLQVTDSGGAVATKLFSLTVTGGVLTLQASGVVNAASYIGGKVAPGEIVSIFGSFPGPSQIMGLQLSGQGYVSTNLSGEQVLFDGLPAPLVYALAGQVSAIVPYEVNGKGSTQVQISYQGQLSNSVSIPVSGVIPGVFTANSSGTGQGSIVNQDGTVNSPSNPAAIGSIVSVFATGEGQTNPTGIDGKVNSSPPPQPTTQPVTATVGNVSATVSYAGGTSGLVSGVLQVNIQLPQGVSGSAVPIAIAIGGITSQGNVTVAIH